MVPILTSISHKPILKMNESYEQALISESKYKLLDQRSPILAISEKKKKQPGQQSDSWNE